MKYYINGYRADENAVLRCLKNEIIKRIIITAKNVIRITTT